MYIYKEGVCVVLGILSDNILLLLDEKHISPLFTFLTFYLVRHFHIPP